MKIHNLAIFFSIALLSITVCYADNIAKETLAIPELAPCPSSPNCVSSTDANADEYHHIAAFSVNSPAQWQLLQTTLLEMPRTRQLDRSENYLHAVVTSKILRFKDDIELLYQPDKQQAQVRSASRLGRSDFSVNRKRVEELRSRYLTARK